VEGMLGSIVIYEEPLVIYDFPPTPFNISISFLTVYDSSGKLMKEILKMESALSFSLWQQQKST
jgi:hypothetical protein